MPVARRLSVTITPPPLDLRCEPLTETGRIDFLPWLSWKETMQLDLSTTGFEMLGGEDLQPAVPSPATEIAVQAPAPPAVEQRPPAAVYFLPVEWPAALDLAFPRISDCETVSPAALRVHLPKANLMPLRAKFAWAPPPDNTAEPAAPPAEETGAVRITAVHPLGEPDAPTSITPGHPASPGNPTVKGRPVLARLSTGDIGLSIAEAPSDFRDQELKEGTRVKSRPNRAGSKTKRTTAPVDASASDEVKPAEPPQAETPPVEPPPPPVAEAVESPTAAPAPVTFDVPHLCIDTGELSPISRISAKVPAWLKVAVLVAALGGAAAYFFSNSGTAAKTPAQPVEIANAPSSSAIAMGGGGWTTEFAADDMGSELGRRLSLYRPSFSMTDYRLEFSGQIETKALGWVFRVSDPKNYYAMKLEEAGGGQVRLVRFAVVGGEEQGHTVVSLSFPVRADSPLKVRMEAKGPKFTTYVQGQAVDFWTDSQLKTGAVGFCNERGERAKVESVQISF
jgi:hypothetical protein